MAHTQYGIGVTKNRFELFDDEEEDPLEVLKVREQEKEARKKSRLSEKENKGKEPTTKGKTQTIRKGIKETTQNLKLQDTQRSKEENIKTTKYPPRIERGERRFNGEREEHNNRRNKDDRPGTDVLNSREDQQSEKREYRSEMRGYFRGESRDMRGRGRGGISGIGRGGIIRGGSRGRAQRPGYDNRGKREYERQSGSDKTGVKPIDKRDGSGAHNWGTHRDDLESVVPCSKFDNPNRFRLVAIFSGDVEFESHVTTVVPRDIQNASRQQAGEDTTAWTVDKADEIFTESNSGGPGEVEEVVINNDEEPRELTLDEWKAMRGTRQKPVYNLRKAGEGEDLSQWKKMYELQKKKDGEDDDDEDEDEYESCEYPQRVGRQKHVLDIDIHFKDARGRGRGGRGGRGGPRLGGRPPIPPPEKIFEQDENRPRKIAPKVDDEHDFPSLG